MTTILVRKHTAKPTFHPHYNRTMGKYYGNATEFNADLTRLGLEVATTQNQAKPRELKPYKPSKWAHDIVESVRGGRVSDRVRDELRRVGVKPAPKRLLAHYDKGGFV